LAELSAKLAAIVRRDTVSRIIANAQAEGDLLNPSFNGFN
jgi:hypothetical protein